MIKASFTLTNVLVLLNILLSAVVFSVSINAPGSSFARRGLAATSRVATQSLNQVTPPRYEAAFDLNKPASKAYYTHFTNRGDLLYSDLVCAKKIDPDQIPFLFGTKSLPDYKLDAGAAGEGLDGSVSGPADLFVDDKLAKAQVQGNKSLHKSRANFRDVSEGTSIDPLRNQTFDLNSSKDMPANIYR